MTESEMEKKINDIHDVLIGTYEKPGLVRIVEKVCEDMYSPSSPEDGIKSRVQRLERTWAWVLGVAAGVGACSAAIVTWLKSLGGTKP